MIGRTRVVAALVLTLTPLAFGSPAHAEDRLGLSRDGRTWAPALDGPLFDPDVRWVPGDVRTATFYARNESTDGARLTIDLSGVRDETLLATGDLDVTARADGGASVPVDDEGTRRLLEVDDVAHDEPVRVSVTARFRDGSTNQSQVERLRLRFLVTLREAVPTGVGQGGAAGQTGATGASSSATVDGLGQGEPATGPTDGPSWLPGTGGPAGWLLLVGGLLVGVGSALVGRRRRDGPAPPIDHRPQPHRTDHPEASTTERNDHA